MKRAKIDLSGLKFDIRPTNLSKYSLNFYLDIRTPAVTKQMLKIYKKNKTLAIQKEKIDTCQGEHGWIWHKNWLEFIEEEI